MFRDDADPQLCQGDILEGITVRESFSPPSDFPLMILSNDCDIDKIKMHAALLTVRVAPMANVEKVDKGLAGHIRQGRVPMAMHIDSPGHRFHDHYIDFRYVHRVPREEIESAFKNGQRATCLTEQGRLAVVGRFSEMLSRRNLPKSAQAKLPAAADANTAKA